MYLFRWLTAEWWRACSGRCTWYLGQKLCVRVCVGRTDGNYTARVWRARQTPACRPEPVRTVTACCKMTSLAWIFFVIVENARQSHTLQWASGHVRSRSEECMWRVLGGWRKLKKITRFSFPLLLKRKKYFTNPSCLPHWQRKTSPRSTALVTAESVCNYFSAHAGIPHWSRALPPPSKLTLAFDRRFGNTRDRFLNERNHLSYQKLHIRKRLLGSADAAEK